MGFKDRKYNIDVKDWLERRFDNVRPATYPDVAVCCPFCNDTKHRLYIATDSHGDIEKGWGWCHNCPAGLNRHDFFEIYAMIENLSDKEAAEQLFTDDPEPVYSKVRDAYNRWLARQNKTETAVEEKVVPVKWPTRYTRLWNVPSSEFENILPAYMKGRGLTQTMCDKYLLGYSIGDYDFKCHMIVPIYQHDSLVGFQGRAMLPSLKPKYRFMTGIVAGDYLFNLDNIPSTAKEVILVEGVFDAWGVIKCGFPNVVASFGKHLTSKGIKTLVSRFESVLLFWDSDAKLEIAALAEELEGMIQVKVAFLDGKDPDEADPAVVKAAILAGVPYSRSFKRQAMKELIYKKTK